MNSWRWHRILCLLALGLCAIGGAQQGTATNPKEKAGEAQAWHDYARQQIKLLEARQQAVNAEAEKVRARLDAVEASPAASLEDLLAGIQRTRARSLDEKGKLALEMRTATSLGRYRLQTALDRLDAASGPLAGQILDLRDAATKLDKFEAARRLWAKSMGDTLKELDTLAKQQARTITAWKSFADEEAARERDAQEAERQSTAVQTLRLPAGPIQAPAAAGRPDCDLSGAWVATITSGGAESRIRLQFTAGKQSPGVLEVTPVKDGDASAVKPSAAFAASCRNARVELKFQADWGAKIRLRQERNPDSLKVVEVQKDPWWSFPIDKGLVLKPER